MSAFHWIQLLLLIACCGCQISGPKRIAKSPRARTVVGSPHRRIDAAPESTGSPAASAKSQIQLASAEVPAEPLPAELPGPTGSPRVAPSGFGALSLSDSISLALAQNPDLIALRENENVGTATLGYARTYPFNPYLQVQATPWEQTRILQPIATYHYVLLMQTIQLAHQQQYREDTAESALNSIRWNIHQAELLAVAQTERLYFSTLYQRGLLELATASHQNNEELLRTLELQLDAGQANGSDVAIVRVDARSTKQQVRLALANYETALRDLKRQLGMPPDDPTEVVGDLRLVTWKIPAATGFAEPQSAEGQKFPLDSEAHKAMILSWAAARPDVMAAQADSDVARAARNLASANKVPDLQVGPYYQETADGTLFMGFRAHMDLPVINSGRPLERQRMAEFNQRLQVWQQLQRRAELEAGAAWERYLVAYQALAEEPAYGLNDLPDELRSLEQQFVAGEVEVVRVVQARASIIQNQRVRLDLLNEIAQAAANLTAAAGIPLEELLSDTRQGAE